MSDIGFAVAKFLALDSFLNHSEYVDCIFDFGDKNTLLGLVRVSQKSAISTFFME